MVKQTLKIVSFLLLSLFVGIAVTLIIDKIENIAVEKRILKSAETSIRNAVSSFKESAPLAGASEENKFIKKFIASVMKDKVVVREPGPTETPGADDIFLFTLYDEDFSLNFYLQRPYLRSELAILDVPDYLSGLVATIVSFAFIIFYTENRKRTLLMQQQFALKHAELDSVLKQHEALALLGRMSAALAHELKTPVATISNLVQTFPSRRTDEQFVKRFLELTREELNRTQQLIDNLLAYGKEVDIRNSEWTDIAWFVKKAAAGGIASEVREQFSLFGDKFYLDLLFKNLFRNSRDAGADRVGIRLANDERRGAAEIFFEDNGAGFPSTADLEKMTDPFVTSRSRGGGLGLYLAKKIAGAHGGSLSLARRDRGARVVIALPAERVRMNS